MADEDKSLGRKILSFFVKDEDQPGVAVGTLPPPAPAVPRPAPNMTIQDTSPPAASNQPTAADTTVSIDPKFAGHFADVLAQNNPPGPDYFEFRETLRSLGSLGLTEDKQFQAAWASFKALGGPGDISVLTNTANGYIAALNKDRDAFGKSVEAALTERVGSLQHEQKRLASENQALANQLVQIQKQMDANQTRLTAIAGDIDEQSGKITQNKQSYEFTFAHFIDQIKADIGKMTQYLK